VLTRTLLLLLLLGPIFFRHLWRVVLLALPPRPGAPVPFFTCMPDMPCLLLLQAFVEGGVAGTAAKAALLSKLEGCWGDVALQAAGSFFLEKAYAWAVSDTPVGICRFACVLSSCTIHCVEVIAHTASKYAFCCLFFTMSREGGCRGRLCSWQCGTAGSRELLSAKGLRMGGE
jgi:hypothetical protein